VRLKRFRLCNYKSIKDSGWCWVASDLTILAGKNESGKTAVLEALRDFDIEAVLPPTSTPIQNDNEPVLDLVFDLGASDIEEIVQALNPLLHETALERLLANDELALSKDYADTYLLPDEVMELIAADPNYEAPAVTTYLKTLLPRFVFFSSFEDVLPFETDLATAASNPAVADFAEVAGIDLAALAGLASTQKRKNLLRRSSGSEDRRPNPR